MKLLKYTIVVSLLIGLLGWWLAPTDSSDSSNQGDNSLDMVYKVERSDMIIGILASGTVNAIKNHKIALEASVPAKISWLIDENTSVKKDDVLIKFDDEKLKNQVEDYKLEVENQIKSMEIAKEELEILKSSNKADLRQAQDRVRDAEEAFVKYIKLQGPQAKDDQQLKIENAIKAVDDAKQAVVDAESKHSNTVYDTREKEQAALTNIENLKKAVDDKELAYDKAILDRKLFKRFDYPNKIISLENSLTQAKLNLQKTKVRTSSGLVQKENSIIRNKNNLKRKREQYEQHKKYLGMMELKAPVDGVVIYGDPSRRWDNNELKVGSDVYKGRALMTIPDLSSMLVDFDLPEQYRSRVATGNEVVVTPDSLPSLKIRGKVTNIAPLPVNQIYWDRNSPKIYKSKVEFSTHDKRLVSGMSAQLEIITKELKNVLSIPVEAVFEENGQFYVYVKNGGKRPDKQIIEIGQADDDSVEITKGLAENDEIYLYNPFISED